MVLARQRARFVRTGAVAGDLLPRRSLIGRSEEAGRRSALAARVHDGLAVGMARPAIGVEELRERGAQRGDRGREPRGEDVARPRRRRRVLGLDGRLGRAGRPAAVAELRVAARVARARDAVPVRRQPEPPVWKSTTGLGGPHQTSELSISVKSKSIRLIFGRIACSRQVLEARRKCSCQNIRIRAH